MDNNNFSEMVQDLADIYLDPEYYEFRMQYDIGVPAAYLIAEGLVTEYTDELSLLIVSTWNALQNE